MIFVGQSLFSRAFAELARQEFGQRVHAAVVERTQAEKIACPTGFVKLHKYR
jgi:hypothetical protein